jgi:hypothetical protein
MTNAAPLFFLFSIVAITPRVGSAAFTLSHHTISAIGQQGSKFPELGRMLRLAGLAPLPFLADIVAKVENRNTLEISRKLIFGTSLLLRRFQRHCGGPGSILDQPGIVA